MGKRKLYKTTLKFKLVSFSLYRMKDSYPIAKASLKSYLFYNFLKKVSIEINQMPITFLVTDIITLI